MIQVESFFNTSSRWKEEYNTLREIILENKQLKEDFKWMHPCYTYLGNNIVLIHGFKDYCALLFHKGVLLKDQQGLLIQQTKNVQSARQLRFKNVDEIISKKIIIENFIKDAIEVEKRGDKVELKPVSEYTVPEEFQKALNEDKNLSNAFYNLTPGRQKGYLLYFGQAKQSKTRQERIAKFYDKIILGKGIDD
ncbi:MULTISPECIES: YdeI/OmpD-associated family protein [Chryseobacterium]|uniref:Uncharacterized protein YdeI (YjbR/CyaY-like superfamily) n=1 Tax=Chryseobacterium camelliae TaxID=1265445 RepID=A0ABU0TJ46_9FLAO|nr:MULTISPECIES: DUF1801 domain-containing protein [Chryseobacterium]MDT3409067.1 uncharacterized protein YdeI (YjbR/CyaY-like superfamily) [Pseudacidovorax intermedius]MDQ1097075.1 uncharacterized protein YdeI (YjbR/CyaY-like superfamily) [Chryseobacterium camelliae]MDQ1101013.1 uncharacterized protein YdeI (YjbR/CyaY-like superfamily) [Chryseobacterium sp. SORGH_AS_1048]MDR6084455.1 uncharacterized protein YdeI (YjbR/CyaY-like superfamily) [Chryseobacterium sp. SORGH_AS_0909]MDR6132726.1 unc